LPSDVEWNYRKIGKRKSAVLSTEGENGMSAEREKKGVEEREKKGVEERGGVIGRKGDGKREGKENRDN
jgi:hypothetical protein